MTSVSSIEFRPSSDYSRHAIEVFYPKPDPGSLPAAAIEELRRFESVIVQKARSFFLSDSDYHWEVETETSPPTHVWLVQTRHDLKVVSIPIEFIPRCTVEEFREILRRA